MGALFAPVLYSSFILLGASTRHALDADNYNYIFLFNTLALLHFHLVTINTAG